MKTSRPVVCVLTAAALGLSLAAAWAAVSADEPAKPDSKQAAKAMVTHFYKNLAAGKAKENEGLFVNAEVPLTGVARMRDPVAWRKKPAEYLTQHGAEPKYLEVELVEVDLLHPALATARVKYKAGGYKGYAALTLTADGERWRIAQLYEETFFTW